MSAWLQPRERRRRHAGEVEDTGPRARGAGRGFTLIELLAVVACLAILAAFLFPAFAQARDAGRRACCLAHLCQIARAQLLYMEDYDERFPHWNFPAPPRPEPYGDFAYWTEYFQPYLRCEAILHDQGANWLWEMPEAEKLAEYTLATWGQGGKGTQTQPFWNWPGRRHTLATVRRPAETLTVMCGFTTGGWTSLELKRHAGGMNAAFVDGHARWMVAGEFWSVSTDGADHWWMRYASVDR